MELRFGPLGGYKSAGGCIVIGGIWIAYTGRRHSAEEATREGVVKAVPVRWTGPAGVGWELECSLNLGTLTKMKCGAQTHLQILGAEFSYAKAVRTSLLKKTKRNCTLRMTIEMITVQPLKEECRRMFLQIFTPSFLLQC